MTDSSKAKLAVRLLAVCLLVEGFMSARLWIGVGRAFPKVGIISLPDLLEYALVLLAGTALVGLIIRPRWRVPVAVFAGASILLVLDDTIRLQPWLYLMGLFLVLGTAFLAIGKDAEWLKLLRLGLAGVYFWSGIQKLNPWFAEEMFPWLCDPLFPDGWGNVPAGLAYLCAGLECAAGLALLFRPTRKVGVGVLVGTHVFILLSLGPTGHNWNVIVWPWNLCFAALLMLVARAEAAPCKPQRIAGALMIGLLWLLPAGNLGGYWDHFLSSGFYSNIAPDPVFYFHPDDASQFPPQTLPFQMLRPEKNEQFVMLTYWALDELSVPVYPEIRVDLAIGRKLCGCMKKPENAGLQIEVRERWSKRGSLLNFPCGTILAGNGL